MLTEKELAAIEALNRLNAETMEPKTQPPLSQTTYSQLAEELRQIRLAVRPLVQEGKQRGMAAGEHINNAESLLARRCSDLLIDGIFAESPIKAVVVAEEK